MFSTCFSRFGRPRSTAAASGFERSWSATPPCILRARTVATSTTAAASRPALVHLMSKNFSAPRSKPKPASVTAQSARCIAMRVASTELQPWAMFANGPPWTSAGVPSSVCTRLGSRASCSSASMAPVAPSWSARTGSPSPGERRPGCGRGASAGRRRPSARHSIAITSDAAVMSKPVSRGTPWAGPPSPTITWRSARSFMSITRRHTMRRGSMIERVAVVEVVVEQRREQVVGGGHGVEVAREVQVDAAPSGAAG